MRSPLETATRDCGVPPPLNWKPYSPGNCVTMLLKMSPPTVCTTMYTRLSGNCPLLIFCTQRGRM